MSTQPGMAHGPRGYSYFTAVMRPGGYLKFYGSNATEHPGAWTAKIYPEDFDRLAKLVMFLKFDLLRPKYSKPITDHRTTTMTVRRGSRSKSVENYANSAPANEWALEILFNSVLDNAQDWKPLRSESRV